MAGWGLGQGRGPGGGGPAWAPAVAASSAPPAGEVSCCNQSPVCVGLGLGLEPEEEERLGGEGKEAATGGFLRRLLCCLLATLICHGFLSLLFFLVPGPSLGLHLYSCLSGYLQLKSFSPCASLLSVSPSNLVRWSLGSLPHRHWPHGHNRYYPHNI